MPEPVNLCFIHDHVQVQLYRLTKHATIIRLERGVAIAELEQALLNGEIIERYPDDKPYPFPAFAGTSLFGARVVGFGRSATHCLFKRKH